jgi:hypothetical protein
MSSGFFVGKLRQFLTAFMEQRALILMLVMMFWPANNINNQPTMSITSSQQCQKPATKLMVSHQLNSLSTNQ